MRNPPRVCQNCRKAPPSVCQSRQSSLVSPNQDQRRERTTDALGSPRPPNGPGGQPAPAPPHRAIPGARSKYWTGRPASTKTSLRGEPKIGSPPCSSQNTQADAGRVEIDLDRPRLAGLWQELDVGEDVPTMSSVSQASSASWEGFVPSRPIPPVVYGLSSGTAALPSSALMIGAPSFSATCSSSSVAPHALPAAGHPRELDRKGADAFDGVAARIVVARAGPPPGPRL